MLAMEASRELSDDFKLSARSIEEVEGLLLGLEKLIKSDKSIRYLGGRGLKKPTRASILNALLFWLDAQPPAVQRRIVLDGMGRLNAVLSGQPPPAIEAASFSPGADFPDGLVAHDEAGERESPRRRTKGG
jgi:hypothetical protein